MAEPELAEPTATGVPYEVRQLVRGLDPAEDLSPGQLAEIDRVWAAYPWLRDDDFVAEGLSRWLA